MNVIHLQTKQEKSPVTNRSGCSGTLSQSSVISFPQNSNTPNSQKISSEQREKAIAILLKEAEELDQA